MSCSSLPYFCPRCGDLCRFSSVPELRAHLVSQHTYETLLVLSQVRARSSNPGSLVPLPSPTAAHKPRPPFQQQPPSQLDCLDLASSQLLLGGEVFLPGGPPGTSPCTALALPGTLMDAFPGGGDLPLGQVPAGIPLGLGQSLGLEFGLWPPEGLSLGVGLEERLGLGLDPRIRRTLAEVEERVSRRVNHLEEELDKREAELQQHGRHSERLGREKQEMEERASYLSRQVTIAMEMMEEMRKHLEGKERELSQRHQEMVDIECFLRETAVKEADAKDKLQVFIETLLERADRAERQLFLLTSHAHKHNYTRDDCRRAHTPPDVYTPPPHRAGHSLDGSTDDIIGPKPQSIMGNRRSYSVSGEYLYSSHYNRRSRRHHSTEEEEEDEDDEDSWNTHETGDCSPLRAAPSRPRHGGGDRALGADTLRLRAGLFCVFPYLDVASLLLAAEVCYDWRFVARHPAVWTRLHLENARVSAKFLCTLSQWCTQTHTVILKNLRPRHKRTDESRQDYHRNTRGMLESGVEALLRSTGGSLVQLSVSQCPHILTDRCLWLASCYCRNLHTLTYRSSSDPLGHEVVWALGAGCRNITHLQVAPNHPCQQSTRFSNRCLQTIGRCWPNLLSLSVGGAGCGAQGLAAVVRSCINLQVLELERITDLGLQVAAELCKEGLKNLQTLILTHTPVSGQAILHFHSACVHLRSIVVEVSAADYFEDTDSQETRTLFEDIINTLQVLQRRPGLCDILKIKTEVFC